MYDVLNAYLENGLKIILHRIEGVKTISCGLWVKQGSKYETNKDNGLSHLTEHLMLNAPILQNKGQQTIYEKVSNMGVVYNAATTKEYTCFYFTGLDNTLNICLSYLSCIAKKNSFFPNEYFENEKKVVLREASSFYSSFQQIKERTSQAIWGNVGVGKIIMGDIKNIENATQEQILQLIKNSYVPENATVVVVGNIQLKETLQIIEEEFSDWIDNKKKQISDIADSAPGIYLNKGNGQNGVLSIGFRSLAYQDELRIATEMLVRIIGQSGIQARIIQEIRVKRGLAYTVGGFSSFYEKRGTVGFMAVCDKSKIIEVASIIKNVLLDIKNQCVTEEEIEREKHMMETALLLDVDNITEHLRYIGKCAMMNNNFFIENEIRKIRNTQKIDIQKAIDELLQENNMGIAAIGECDFDKLLDAVVFS